MWMSFIKKREREREEARGAFCIKCGHICLSLTGCDQHLKGFLIRHAMSHTSQRTQSIPWTVTKRVTPLPSLLSSHSSIYGSRFSHSCVMCQTATGPWSHRKISHCFSNITNLWFFVTCIQMFPHWFIIKNCESKETILFYLYMFLQQTRF